MSQHIIRQKYCVQELAKIVKGANDWENMVEETYSEDDALTIHSFLSYFENVRNGFQESNNEKLYQAQITEDFNGTLYREAVVGDSLLRKVFIVKSHFSKSFLRKFKRFA